MALLTITSHHHLHRSHNTLRIHKSEIVTRQLPAPLQQYLSSSNHGTRVSVDDLFGNMPVRVKQRALTVEKQGGTAKEWTELRHEIVKIILPWMGDLITIVRVAGTSQKIVVRAPSPPVTPGNTIISRACSVLSQTSYIAPEEKASWIDVGGSAGKVQIVGAISHAPAAAKSAQFLSFGVKSISSTSILHNEINRLFVNSSFGSLKESEGVEGGKQGRHARERCYKDKEYIPKDLKKAKKGVDRWPKFFLTINLEHPDTPSYNLPIDVEDVVNSSENDLETIIELLQAIVWEFLSKQGFQPNHAPSLISRSQRSNPIQHLSKISDEKALPNTEQRSSVDLPPTQSVLKHGHSSFDPLGININLPSFRQIEFEPDSALDSCTKMKYGKMTSGHARGASSMFGFDKTTKLQRPVTASPASPIRGLSWLNPGNITIVVPRPARVMLSHDGKVIRRPFDDTEHPTSKVTLSTVLSARPRVSKIAENDTGNLATWVNPVTKVKTIVNTQTGFAMLKKSISRQSLQANDANKIGNPSPWITNILKYWDNPIFVPVQQSITKVLSDRVNTYTRVDSHTHYRCCSQLDIERSSREAGTGIKSQISKLALRNSEVVAQLDNKFILIKVRGSKLHSCDTGDQDYDGSLLVIVDQHAADERIRVETLLEYLCSPDSKNSSKQSFAHGQALEHNLIFEISSEENRLLETCEQHFAHWGIMYEVSRAQMSLDSGSTSPKQHVTIWALPSGIIERCKQDPRLLIDLIRAEVWKIHEMGGPPSPKYGAWYQRIHTCPQGLLDMLISRACRSAIMFNDVLTMRQCQTLVSNLADCRFPFQCAHGRPSLVPLVEIESLKTSSNFSTEVGSHGFGRSFKNWKVSGMISSSLLDHK